MAYTPGVLDEQHGAYRKASNDAVARRDLILTLCRDLAWCSLSSFHVLGAPTQRLPSLARNGAEKIEVSNPGAENACCSSIVKSSKREAPLSSTLLHGYTNPLESSILQNLSIFIRA